MNPGSVSLVYPAKATGVLSKMSWHMRCLCGVAALRLTNSEHVRGAELSWILWRSLFAVTCANREVDVWLFLSSPGRRGPSTCHLLNAFRSSIFDKQHLGADFQALATSTSFKQWSVLLILFEWYERGFLLKSCLYLSKVWFSISRFYQI